MTISMPVPKEQKRKPGELFVPESGSFSVRANCSSAGGGFFKDKTESYFKGSLEMVVVGYKFGVGTVPPISNYTSLVNTVKQKLNLTDQQVNKLSADDLLTTYATQLAQLHCILYFWPIPTDLVAYGVSPEEWPPEAMCSTIVRSIGLSDALSDSGYFQNLQMRQLGTSEVITVFEFEPSKSGNDYFISKLSFYKPEPKTDEEKFTQKCQKAVLDWVLETGKEDFITPALPDEGLAMIENPFDQAAIVEAAQTMLLETAAATLDSPQDVDIQRILNVISDPAALLPDLTTDATQTVEVTAV